MQAQMVQFKEQLETFAKKYKNDIKKDETFRQNFQSMCTSIGVDPLACKSNILFIIIILLQLIYTILFFIYLFQLYILLSIIFIIIFKELSLFNILYNNFI